MSLHPPEPPDSKKNAIVETGKEYAEGDPRLEPIKYYKVVCPRCKAQPGFPCFTDLKRRSVDYRTICISRVLLYEAFILGTTDVNGISKNGYTFKGKSWGPE
jgi:hypothetical protein